MFFSIGVISNFDAGAGFGVHVCFFDIQLSCLYMSVTAFLTALGKTFLC